MYKLSFSEKFDNDVDLTLDYFKYELKTTIAARNFFDKLIERLEYLKRNPHAWSLVKDDDLRFLGVRALVVKKYILFYIINEDEKIVKLARFLDGRSDWMNILKEEFAENSNG